MGIIFPLAAHRSPFLCTVYAFVAPCVYGAVAGGATYVTARYFVGTPTWVYLIAALVTAITVYSDFGRIRSAFQQGGVVTLRAVLLQLPLTAALFSLITAAGCASYPFFSTWLPGRLDKTDYAKVGEYAQKIAPILSFCVAGLTASFATLFGSLRGAGDSVRGERIGTIASIREKLGRRRLKRERAREDKILARIHRDGGPHMITEEDIQFLKRRSKLPRWQRG
jgi:hypothetical protein